MNSDRVSGDPKNPADAPRIMQTTGALLNGNLQDATGQLKQAIKDTQSQGSDAGDLQDALQTAQAMKVNLDSGYPLDPSQLAMLQAKPGMPVNVANSLADVSEFNRLSQLVASNAPSQPSPLGAVKTLLHVKHTLGMLGLGVGAGDLTQSLPVGLGVAAIPMAIKLGGRLWNMATSEPNPVGELTTRFRAMQKTMPTPVGTQQGIGQPLVSQSGEAAPLGQCTASGSGATPLRSSASPHRGISAACSASRSSVARQRLREVPSPQSYGDGFVMEPGAYGYEGSGPQTPTSPKALPPPMRALPKPLAAYGPEGAQSFRMSATGPLEGTAPLLEGVRALQKAGDTQEPVVDQSVPEGRSSATVSGIATPGDLPHPADVLEDTLRRTQETLDDPNASKEAKQMRG